jgi:hypothetical protein
VLLDAFNHLGIDEVVRNVWLAADSPGLLGGMQDRGARYLVVADPFRHIVSLLPQATPPLAVRFEHANVQSGRLYTARIHEFALFRLFVSWGFQDEFARLRPRYFSSVRDEVAMALPNRTENLVLHVPGMQVYELVPGAVLQGRVPESTRQLTLQCQLRFPEDADSAQDLQRRVQLSADGSFSVRTGLPAPIAESSFEVVHGYSLKADGLETTVPVPLAAVLRGSTIEVVWPGGN